MQKKRQFSVPISPLPKYHFYILNIYSNIFIYFFDNIFQFGSSLKYHYDKYIFLNFKLGFRQNI